MNVCTNQICLILTDIKVLISFRSDPCSLHGSNQQLVDPASATWRTARTGIGGKICSSLKEKELQGVIIGLALRNHHIRKIGMIRKKKKKKKGYFIGLKYIKEFDRLIRTIDCH